MNPSSNVGMELPPPVSEQLTPVDPPEQAENTSEQQPVSPFEALPRATLNQPLVAPPPQLAVPNSNFPLTQDAGGASGTADDQASDLAADDGDLIEKEWVNKAKAIVERTREDPYKQSEELTLLKADYLQKRYNKTLKQSN